MPVSDQMRIEIARYLIGPKVRALRLRRSMGLMQLGERTGLSPALLSKIENSKLVPTVPTLLRKFLPYLAEFYPTTEGSGRSHMHQGFEFIHVLCGTLELLIGSDVNILGPGDSIYFDSNLRHAYRRVGKDKCNALMVLAYPERILAERRMERLEGVHAVRQKLKAVNSGHMPEAQRFKINGNGTSHHVKSMETAA